jgi:hypothetical protein
VPVGADRVLALWNSPDPGDLGADLCAWQDPALAGLGTRRAKTNSTKEKSTNE